jgi:acetate kinase
VTDGLLVLNAGSSSLKFAVFGIRVDADELAVTLRGQIANIGSASLFSTWRQTNDPDGETQRLELDDIDSHQQAIAFALDWIEQHSAGMSLRGVGHRVVHGGSTRDAPALITPALLEELDALSPLAPHHQPHNLAAIRAIADAAPQLRQVACFDTAFHAVQPAVARRLPLPARYRDKGLQRYGFHGLSYEYITAALADRHAGRLPARLIVAHLGNGASLCAIRDGRSIASSMGFSTLDGLLMGSRCGTLDPGVLLHLLREERMDERALSDLLYNHSGLLGVSGISSDMQVLLNSDAPAAAEAVELFCYTLVRAIGSMTAALGGVDALVFTGGIGEHAAAVRARVCGELAWLGLAFDAQSNERGVDLLTRADSRVKVWVIPTNEELVIARHTRSLVSGARDLQPNNVKS